MKVIVKNNGQKVDEKHYRKEKVANRFIEYMGIMARNYKNFKNITTEIQ